MLMTVLVAISLAGCTSAAAPETEEVEEVLEIEETTEAEEIDPVRYVIEFPLGRYSTLRDIETEMMRSRVVSNRAFVYFGEHYNNPAGLDVLEAEISRILLDMDGHFANYRHLISTDPVMEPSHAQGELDGFASLEEAIVYYIQYVAAIVAASDGGDLAEMIQLSRDITAAGAEAMGWHQSFHIPTHEFIFGIGDYHPELEAPFRRYSLLRDFDVALLNIERVMTRTVMYMYLDDPEVVSSLVPMLTIVGEVLGAGFGQYRYNLQADSATIQADLDELQALEIAMSDFYGYAVRMLMLAEDADQAMELLHGSAAAASEARNHIGQMIDNIF